MKITGIFYKSPMNLSYWWSFGALSLYFLIVQIITGIFLAMFYNPSVLMAFKSIMYIKKKRKIIMDEKDLVKIDIKN